MSSAAGLDPSPLCFAASVTEHAEAVSLEFIRLIPGQESSPLGYWRSFDRFSKEHMLCMLRCLNSYTDVFVEDSKLNVLETLKRIEERSNINGHCTFL